MSDARPGSRLGRSIEPQRRADKHLETKQKPEPRRVRRLPGALIDQIAAGEVVERPASVVKELVENALDAGATRIQIEIRAGGVAWIAVADDGCGMSREDAELALERHATSKLRSADDLARIGTFGFRGEALPAIASVSRFSLRTRAAGASAATEIAVDHGRRIHVREVGAPLGTRIEVADLFAGVPARRKFLKRESTEWNHVADSVTRIALAQPGVRFELRRDDRPAWIWPAVADPLERVAAAISEADAAAFVPLAGEEGAVRLTGFVSRPDHHRATQAGIYLFVNERPVRDRLLAHALLEAYRDVLPRGRFPAALIFLRLAADAVDVNVHPAKAEVRFADPQQIHRLLRRAARAALAERSWIGAAPAAALGSRAPLRGEPAAGARFGASRSARTGDWVLLDADDSAPQPDDWRARPEPGASAAQQAELLPIARDAADGARGLRFASLPLLGQLLATYLVLEAPAQLLLIDQHAAHERVLFEGLRAAWRSRAAKSQPLLVPETLELAPAAAEALLAAEPELTRAGFELDRFGERTLVVRALPELLADRDPRALLAALGDELADAESRGGVCAAPRDLPALDRLFASIACHAARRKGDRIDPREQRALLAALDAIPWAPTCPHGRPVAVPVEEAELERRFARR
jgi:DNA mismatch repair protein MutL